MDLTRQIAKRIDSDGGGALIIDYGKDGLISDSLQVPSPKKKLRSIHKFHFLKTVERELQNNCYYNYQQLWLQNEIFLIARLFYVFLWKVVWVS